MHTGLDIVGLHPAGADTELVTSTRHDLKGCRGLGEDDGMSVVDVIDEGSDLEIFGYGGEACERRCRLPLAAEMVRQKNRVIAHLFDAAGVGLPCGGGQFGDLDSEAERMGHDDSLDGVSAVVGGFRPRV